MSLKRARTICFLVLAAELAVGLAIYLIHRFSLATVKPNPALLRPIYYAGAGIVVLMLVLKRTMLRPSRFAAMDEGRMIPAVASSFVVLSAVASSLAGLALVLYFTTGLLKYSLIMILIAVVTTLMVFPYGMAVEGLVYEAKRLRERSSPS